jgi:hypothetical protein
MIQVADEDVPGFLIKYAMKVDGKILSITIETNPNYIFLDKSSSVSSSINTHQYDDLIDKTQNVNQMSKEKEERVKYPDFLSNNKFVVDYDISEILEVSDKEITSNGFSKTNCCQ